jgi:hypothetical protein
MKNSALILPVDDSVKLFRPRSPALDRPGWQVADNVHLFFVLLCFGQLFNEPTEHAIRIVVLKNLPPNYTSEIKFVAPFVKLLKYQFRM